MPSFISKKALFFFLIITFTLLVSNAFAFDSSRFLPDGFAVTVGTGVDFASHSGTNFIDNKNLPPLNNIDTYTSNSDSKAGGIFLLADGYRWQHNSAFLPMTMLQFTYMLLTSNDLSGDVLKLSNPTADNYRYHYVLHSHNFLLTFKTDLTNWHHFMPYFTAGAGVDLNCFQNYQESAKAGGTVRVSPGFANKVTTNFTYQVGAGIDYLFKKHFLFSLGYLYQNLGDIQSGSGVGATYTGQSLAYAAKTQILLFTLTYLFNNHG